MKPFGHNLIRCALVIVTLAASGIASATLNYDYTNKVLFDSSTNLYWSSGAKDAAGWQVATGQQVTTLFSEVGFSSIAFQLSRYLLHRDSRPRAVLLDGAPSPRPVAGSLPLGDLGASRRFSPCQARRSSLRGGILRSLPMVREWSHPTASSR